MTWRLDDGQALCFRDDVQMGKVYVVSADGLGVIPGYADVGVDVLDPKRFSREKFRKLAGSRRDQVRVFLMDKSAVDSFGNAYADEALFAAGVHPKTWVRSLSDDQLDRLHDAMVATLAGARDTLVQRKPPMDEKLRDFLLVRLRGGQPCPHCGTTIRKAGVRGYDAFFCPSCQPETRKSGIVDWRKLPPR